MSDEGEDEDLDLDEDDDSDNADYEDGHDNEDGAEHEDNADHVDVVEHQDDMDSTLEFVADMALISGNPDLAAPIYAAAGDPASAALALMAMPSSQYTQSFAAAAPPPRRLANDVPSENILWDECREKFNVIINNLIGDEYNNLRRAIEAMKLEVGIYYLTDPNEDALTKRKVVADIIKYTSTFVNDFQDPLLDKEVVIERFIFKISPHPWLAGIASAILVAAISVMAYLAFPPAVVIAPWAVAKIGTFFTAGSFAIGFFAGGGKEFKAAKNIEREAQALIPNSR